MNTLLENADLVSFAFVVVSGLVQITKNFLRSKNYNVDPRFISAVYSGLFGISATLIQIGISGVPFSEVMGNIWTHALASWVLSIGLYKLVHKKKESNETSL